MPRITSVEFKGEREYKDAIATYDNGKREYIFGFYTDELSFTEKELIGLTYEEAIELYCKKDAEYLES